MNIMTWPYTLRNGHSDNPAEGACAMDAINWLVHGKHGDAPECACPIISAYVINGNDRMPDDIRQKLLPYLHRIAGSRSIGHEQARMRILQLAALRIFAANALDSAGLHNHATRLRALPDDVDMKKAAAAAAAAWAAAVAGAAAAAWAAMAAQAAARAAANAAAADAAAADAAMAAWAAWAARAAADAAAWAAAADAAAWAAADAAAADAAAWDDYFVVLDQVLNAGPQGEPWSADTVEAAITAFDMAAA